MDLESDFVYPNTELDQRDQLLSLIGSFWSDLFVGSDLVGSVLHARAQLDAQTHLNMLELLATVSRFNVPLFHTDNWYLLTLQESKLNVTETALPKFDGTRQFSEAAEIQYGVPLATQLFTWDVPPTLAEAKVILNRITAASVTWTHGVDYVLEPGVLRFRTNPFDSPLIPKREVYAGDAVVDREIGLWVYRGQFDWNTMYQQFGYALGLYAAESSQQYKDLVNAVFDALVVGTTQSCIESALSAITDVPIVKEVTERVQYIGTDSQYRLVITDQHVYKFHPDSTVLVNVGDVVHAGQFMTDTVQVIEFNRGQVPDETTVRSLALGHGFLLNGYFQDLVFENKDVPLIVTEPTAENGEYTKVEFSLQGVPADIEKFFDDLHARGVEKRLTLAMLLDRREGIRLDQPTAMNLPTTINPFAFLCHHVLRNHAILVKVRSRLFGVNALGLQRARVFRKIVPPQTVLLVLAQLEYDADAIIMDGPGSETRAGYEETARVYLGSTFSEELDPTVLIAETVRARQIVGRCE